MSITVILHYPPIGEVARAVSHVPRIGELIRLKHDDLAPCDEQVSVEMVVTDIDTNLVHIYVVCHGVYIKEAKAGNA